MYNNYARNYVQELEYLILYELLPVYEQWHKEHNIALKESRLPKDLIRDVKRKQVVPALCKP